MIGMLLRMVGCLAAAGSLAILAAANWPDPDDPAAGVLIGLGFMVIGAVAGMLWAHRYADRTGWWAK